MVRCLYFPPDNDFKFTVLMTEKARANNWEDRKVNESDVENAARWEKELRVNVGEVTQGLENSLKGEFCSLRINPVAIPEGRNTDEIMDIFQIIYDQIEEGDELYFDITHSFRSIPMIVISVLRYAKTLKNCRLKGIIYGAFEAQIDGVTPIIDLSLYDEIIEWSFAAEQFMRFGNAQPMKETYDASKDTDKNSHLNKIVDSMTDLSNALITSRGSSEGGQNAKERQKAKQSIKQAYNIMKNVDITRIHEFNNPAIENLILTARDRYKVLDKNKDFEIGMAVVKLCIDFNMINQGYSALEETIKTFVCEKYGLDSQSKHNREDIVALILGTKSAFNRIKDPKPDPWYFFCNDNDRSSQIYNNASLDDKNLYERIYKEIPDAFAKASSQIADARNDINHFGIRVQPMQSDKFKTQLERLYNEAKAAMNGMTSENS